MSDIAQPGQAHITANNVTKVEEAVRPFPVQPASVSMRLSCVWPSQERVKGL
jgi:hypothetical protein